MLRMEILTNMVVAEDKSHEGERNSLGKNIYFSQKQQFKRGYIYSHVDKAKELQQREPEAYTIENIKNKTLEPSSQGWNA